MPTDRNSLSKDAIVDFSELEADAGVGTCVTNAVTINKGAGQVTTESLSTASGGSQAITVNNAIVKANDLAFVQWAGGTDTTVNLDFIAICTAGILTVTIKNNNAAALNGTVIFNFLIVHQRPSSVL